MGLAAPRNGRGCRNAGLSYNLRIGLLFYCFSLDGRSRKLVFVDKLRSLAIPGNCELSKAGHLAVTLESLLQSVLAELLHRHARGPRIALERSFCPIYLGGV